VKVLQFYRTYFPETQGGLEEAIRQICHSTSKLGVEQRILTMARVPKVETLELPEATVIRVPLQAEPAACSMGTAMFKAYREQAKWADVIQAHHPWPFADLVHLLSGVNKPLVLTYHSDIVRQKTVERLYAPLRSLFYRRVSRFVATSPNYVKSSPVLQSLSQGTDVIPLGLSEEHYPPATEQALEQVRKSYGRDFFLFVGVLRYYKGLHNLVKAAAINGLPVVIAGDGPERERLEAMAKDAGAINVQFAGYVSDDIKQALFQCSRAVVFPSSERSEAFGVTLLEGQLNSKPLISCEIGTGTCYVNQHRETGIVVPPNDPAALANAMSELYTQPSQAIAMGEAAKRRMDALFNGQEVGQAYLELYRQLLNE
jgi:rhamnosyl/mannosyltransferase